MNEIRERVGGGARRQTDWERGSEGEIEMVLKIKGRARDWE